MAGSRTRLVVIVATALAPLTACTGHGAPDPGKTPSGVAGYRSGATASAVAARAGGACTLATVADLTRALGGSAGQARPDALTPGLDECSWQLTRSAAGASANVVIYLPPDQSRGGYDRGHRAARHAVTLHGIGAAAYYDPTTQTLVVQTAHHVAGIQVVTPVTSSHRAIHLQQHMETLAATIAGHLG